MESLTLQVYLNGQWRDAMVVSFDQPEAGLCSRCSATYKVDYVVEQLDEVGSVKAAAVSTDFPLSWEVRRDVAPAFLHDIVPAGAARRHILSRRNVPPGACKEFFLLQRYSFSPIGHMRVKESFETSLSQNAVIGFHREEVIRRDTKFLDYACEQGASMGGALGAGGEAPKFLLVEDTAGHFHPDTVIPDQAVQEHWFIKFPRNSASEIDRNILHSEYCFYQALGKLGVNTVSTKGLAYEMAEKPSLWMRRFDRKITAAGVDRIGVESIYALCRVTRPGSHMSHITVLNRLAEVWVSAGQEADVPNMVSEYLRRDLINQILGNSDNHGRNISILRTSERVDLAPIYDLAPMVMDPEGSLRTTKWPAQIERLNQVDWQAVCFGLAHLADPEWLYERLREDARLLLAVPDMLLDLKLPNEIWKSPMIPLSRLQGAFHRWGLM
ncbi:type II toxin-antitoxin system HipA family toxin [Pseudomonas sp. zjy_13]|uniref:type II toxin-antitoxin system HipA family toxin n=1 Tax=Pseudomonas sp. zjy_13 TaxID=3367263 RepID=UPI00370ACC3B